MNMRLAIRCAVLALSSFGVPVGGADWPMWRCDAGRTGNAPQSLAEQLHLQWTWTLPPLKPAFENQRLQFDRGYEPIVVGSRMFFGSSLNDSLTAVDTRSGRQLWRFFADGPIRAGTLWLDYPNVSGPSPHVDVAIEPADVHYFYQHSLFLRGGRGWPWVAASGVEGVRRATVRGLRAGNYRVRLYFAEPAEASSGSRNFDVSLQGQPWLTVFEIAKNAGGQLSSVAVERSNVASDGNLEVTFTPHAGQPLISGIEIVAEGLPLDEICPLPES